MRIREAIKRAREAKPFLIQTVDNINDIVTIDSILKKIDDLSVDYETPSQSTSLINPVHNNDVHDDLDQEPPKQSTMDFIMNELNQAVQCIGLDNIFDTSHSYVVDQLKQHAKVIINHCSISFRLRNPDTSLPIQTSRDEWMYAKLLLKHELKDLFNITITSRRLRVNKIKTVVYTLCIDPENEYYSQYACVKGLPEPERRIDDPENNNEMKNLKHSISYLLS